MKLFISHKIKDPCTEGCALKCVDKISFERRKEINRQYWNLDKEDFLSKYIKKEVKKYAQAYILEEKIHLNIFQKMLGSWTNMYVKLFCFLLLQIWTSCMFLQT